MKKLYLLLILSVLFFSCGDNENGRYVPYVPLDSNPGILDTRTGIIYQPINDPAGTTDYEGKVKIIKVTETDFIHRTKKQFDFADETPKLNETNNRP